MASLGWLRGIRVVDLGQYLPGPGAAQILADMGADVLKVEPPSGDPLRRIDPVHGGAVDGVSSYYAMVNAGKRVLALDLKTPDGKATFAKLLGAADALVESYRPGVLARLGFGRDVLDRLNPRLVHLSLSGYGATGPLAQAAGHDVTYLAAVGGLAATGNAGGPAIPWPPVADHASAQFAAMAVLGALMGRERTGKGTYIDASLAETALGWQGWSIAAAARGRPPRRLGTMLNGGAAYYNVYAVADGRHVALGAIEPHFWKNFCEAVGRPDWIPRQAEPVPQTALTTEVAALFMTKDRDAWDAMLSSVDCCYHPVLDYAEVASTAQVRARGLVKENDLGHDVAFPALVDGTPPGARSPYRDVTADEALDAWR